MVQSALNAGSGVFTRLRQQLRRPLLVRRIGVGVEEGHGHRFHPLRLQIRQQREQRGLVQRQQGLAVDAHSLRHGEAEVAGHQRAGELDVEVVLVV